MTPHLSGYDLLVICCYFVGLAAFGIFIRRTRGFSDFSVARRAVPPFMVFGSLCAAYIGPGYSLGFAAKGFGSGFALVPVWLCFSIQTCIVGVFLAPRLRRSTAAYTIGGVLGEGYGRSVQQLGGLVSIGLCIGFAGVLARAGGTILSGALGIGMPLGVALIAAVGVLYAWTGGLKSVIATEGLQFSVVLSSVAAVLLSAGRRVVSYASLDRLSSSLTQQGWNSSPRHEMLGLMLLFFFGEMLIPPYANRALSAESETASSRGFLLAGIFSALWFAMMVLLGLLGRQLLGQSVPADDVMIALARAVLPKGLLGLFFVALASIVMSTQESLLNAASVCMAVDLMPGLTQDARKLVVARGSTLIFAILAVFVALRAPSILQGLLVCYSIWAPTIVPPLIWRLIPLPTDQLTGLLSIIGGGSASIYCLLASVHGGDPARAILIGFCGSAAGALLGFSLNRLRRFI